MNILNDADDQNENIVNCWFSNRERTRGKIREYECEKKLGLVLLGGL